MSHVRLQFGLPSGIKNVPDTLLVSVRDLRTEELEKLPDADADTILGLITGLSPDQIARLTPTDRQNIINARREMIA